MSSSSSDDDDDDDEHTKKTPLTLTDQGLVDMVSNCLDQLPDENQVNAVISCYIK